MRNEILEHDKGAMIDTKWFKANENFRQYDSINIETAERILDYEVTKEQLYTFNGDIVPKSFCLWRQDINKPIYPAVGDRYHVVQNSSLINHVAEIQRQYDNIRIESVVTLGNGQSTIINLRIFEHTVKGDDTPTKTRLMLTNSFGGESLTACLHQLRMSCANMMRVAHGQGVANESLKRFRHTKAVDVKMGNHVFDLAKVIGKVKEHNDKLDYLGEKPVNHKFVDNFLDVLMPTLEEAGNRTQLINRKNRIKEIFNGKNDLQNVGWNRYRLLNAITDYNSHEGAMKGNNCQGKRLINVMKGSGDRLNQRAFDLLCS